MKGPGRPWSAACLDALSELLGETPEVTQKVMFGVPAFFVTSRVFCCVWGEGVGLRLPTVQAQSLIGVDALAPFRPFGRAPMSGWIQRDLTLPIVGAERALIEAARAHVRAL